MNAQIEQALQHDRLIDITTLGAKSDKPHKIEIAFHFIDSTVYISGLPGKRDWYANLVAHPDFTFHLKQSMQADIPARATPIMDEPTRRAILARVTANWNRQDQLEEFVKNSPLVRVELLNA